jgi:predicted Zn-dependent protease
MDTNHAAAGGGDASGGRRARRHDLRRRGRDRLQGALRQHAVSLAGDRVRQQATRDIERKNRVEDDPAINARMQRIASRIFPQAARDFDAPFTIKVIDSKDVNAFALPGGPIYFYRGLIDLAESDDEIAAVLGHEAAHITRHHSAKQISDAQGKSVLLDILTQGKGGAIQTLAGLGLALDQLSYSRGDESESDEVGFRYFTAAGYDPAAMASFFRKMKAKSKGSGGPEWLSSHPVTDQRIRRAEQRAAEYTRQRSAQQ